MLLKVSPAPGCLWPCCSIPELHMFGRQARQRRSHTRRWWRRQRLPFEPSTPALRSACTSAEPGSCIAAASGQCCCTHDSVAPESGY